MTSLPLVLGGGQEVDSRQEEGPVLNLQGPPLVIQSSSVTPKKVLQLSEPGVAAEDQMFRHMNDGWAGHFSLKPQLPMHSLLLYDFIKLTSQLLDACWC